MIVVPRNTQISGPLVCVTIAVQVDATDVSSIVSWLIEIAGNVVGRSQTAGRYFGIMCFSQALVLHGKHPVAPQP